MSKAWPRVRLGEVLRHRKQFIFIDDLVTYKRPRARLHAQGIVLRDELPGALIKTKSQQMCRAGDFLVAEIDAKLGGFGLVPDGLDGAIVSSHYFLFEVDEGKLDRRLLDWFSRTQEFRAQVEAQGSTNYAAIRPTHVLSYEMPLPPLAEQRRFVARIQELEHEVAHAARLRDIAAAEAQLLWRRVAATKLERLASSTPHRRIGEIVSVRGGGTPPKSNPVLWEGSIPWISPKDMKVRELHDAQDHISVLATQVTAAKLIDPGAVLIVVRGMILAHTVPSAVLRVPAAVNQDMKALVPTAALLPEYLCSYLWATNDRLLGLVDRSTHDTRKLETDKLLAVEIALPSVSEQRRVVAELSALQIDIVELTTRQKQMATELASLIPSVLNQMFSENCDGRRFC